MAHRKQPKAERVGVNIYFVNYTQSMTVHCFDEDSEIDIKLNTIENL